MRLIFALLLLASFDCAAARVTLQASNAGPITGSGRDLQFDLSNVSGEIKAATLVLSMNYSSARELSFSLIDGSEVVVLPLSTGSAIFSAQTTMIGDFRFSDAAFSTWLQSQPFPSGNLPATIDSRAWHDGNLGQCLNLLGRFLEFDINKDLPLTLRIDRAAGAQAGTGSISAARLILETNTDPNIFRASFDGQAIPITPCVMPSIGIAVNGMDDPTFLTPISLLSFANDQMDWSFRQFGTSLVDAGPFSYGIASTFAYPGRFGGRSRLNMGFWDPATGTLSFTTGSGSRAIELPGDWLSVAYRIIPGDYDGDGVTDLAVALLDETFWVGRIRFSRSGIVRDYLIDPRGLFPADFDSPNIGFGQGQDADRDGADEITLYAEIGRGSTGMRMIQVVVDPSRNGGLTAFSAGQWGIIGDRLVLGKWINANSGNQLGQMVVRRTVTAWEWYLLGNPTPTIWGLPTDIPMSMSVDGDDLTDIAFYRPSDRRVYALRRSNGEQIILDPFGPTSGFVVPIGYALGTTAPLEN